MHPRGLVPYGNVENKRIWSAGFLENTTSHDWLPARKLNDTLENFVQHVPALKTRVENYLHWLTTLTRERKKYVVFTMEFSEMMVQL